MPLINPLQMFYFNTKERLFEEMLFSTDWKVHYQSDRTGVRLIGPKPVWARPDGGEAGLHPSNIHDNAYAIGAVDFTGDMPVILGPDGPSLGGFVCPAVVVKGELWKLVQLKPGDTVFIPRGVVHGFVNETQAMAKMLAVLTPGVLGPEFFREVGALAKPGVPPDPAKVAEVMKRHGLVPAPQG